MTEEPPNIDVVLHAREKVEWAGKMRTDFSYCCSMSFSFVVILFVIGAPFPILSPIKLLGLLYCVIVYAVYIRNVILYPPWYFITSKRLLEAKGTRIVKEVELSRYCDRPIKDFIAM